MALQIPHLLERSPELDELADRCAAVGASGGGRLVFVGGEAGIGKTALIRAFAERCEGMRVLWGGCEALHTPRPLGPFLDIAAETLGELDELVERGAAPADVLAALGRELRRRRSVVVLEDLHWADEATLDVLRLLARRIESVPALVCATFRDDQLDRAHPLRMVLGEIPGGPAISRLSLAPLSLGAVAELAGDESVDAAKLHARTGGNPFYVTEALATGGATIPDTVRDAVLARAARLEPGARALLDAVAIVPARAELWLLEALSADGLGDLGACLDSGMLRSENDGVGFRHEIARVAVEEAMAPDRRVELHRAALAALGSSTGPPVDLARLAHHAEAAGDGEAVLLHAPSAGERAAGLGAHREAAEQFVRALRYADHLPPERRASLLERRAYECYLTDRIADAIEARRRALVEYRALGDTLRLGDAHRWLSRLAWFTGDNEDAELEAKRAIELLEQLPEGRELAMAYSNTAQLRMLATDVAGATHWGGKAIALAERLDETEVLVHALNNVGAAEVLTGSPAGRAKLERSLDLALAAELEEHVARAYTNLGSIAASTRDYEVAVQHLEAGIAYCRERDLDSWVLYMTGDKAQVELGRGDLEAATTSAEAVLDHPGVAAASRITPLTVLALVRARRRDPEPWALLDEALELARGTGELQRVGLVAGARAEAHWLGGDLGSIEAETTDALALALERGNPWLAGELGSWRRRAGIVDPISPADLAEPYRLESEGSWAAAAERWSEIGCPYEAALALAETDDEAALRRGLAELERLGARAAASRVARSLRARGVRDIRRGPRAATRENPAGLTARELEVLELVAEGLRNAQIADRLVVSEKTVGHHVSAILRKLDVSTRAEAAANAARLGIVER